MISVVIRTKDECNNLVKCLSLLSKQTIDHEVIVIDSHSTDSTIAVTESYGHNVIQCDPFTYGKAINIGINKSRGNHIAILSSHCFPIDNDFLAILQKSFDNNNVAGVYGRQIPHKDTNYLEYRNFIYTYKEDYILQKKSPFFNNAASMIRRDIWNNVKFDEEINAQEDILWAKEVMKLGYYIAYEPEAIVEHLHIEDTIGTVNRYLRESKSLKEILCL